jgi:hypothetical protein
VATALIPSPLAKIRFLASLGMTRHRPDDKTLAE